MVTCNKTSNHYDNNNVLLAGPTLISHVIPFSAMTNKDGDDKAAQTPKASSVAETPPEKGVNDVAEALRLASLPVDTSGPS